MPHLQFVKLSSNSAAPHTYPVKCLIPQLIVSACQYYGLVAMAVFLGRRSDVDFALLFSQKYELYKTEDIPKLDSCQFDPQTVKDVASNILAFLRSNTTKEGHTYWLFKSKPLLVVVLLVIDVALVVV